MAKPDWANRTVWTRGNLDIHLNTHAFWLYVPAAILRVKLGGNQPL